ncbi:MAG TPA: autotransporter-associated beta strand repeat-containing protein, partial [Verrucomicrobium sp.]|nr:autotransporter-associated beta strand repeat-containing protein [Verrucomicrobium sp.]
EPTVFTTLSGNLGEDGTSRSLTKSGSGRLVLTGFNTYSGGTIINAGVLQIGITAGSTHTNADAALGAVPSSAATNVTFSGTSTLQLVANALTILNANRNIAINSGVTATFDANGGSLTILGQIAGAGALKTGTAGTVTLANATNSYAGGTTIAGGTVIANGDGAFGSATGSIAFTGSATLQALDTITMGSGRNITLASGATATFNPLGNTITINGQVSGAGNLAISSTSGVVVLAGANNFSGTTIIGDVATPGTAILRLMQANALAATSGITIGRNATDDSSRLQLAFTGTSTFDRNITTTSRNTSVAHVQNVSGNTTLTGAFTTAGAGAQTTFQSDAGELNLQFSSTANSASTIALQGEGDGRVSSNLYSAAATGGLVKNGPGTWRIEAGQTYSGATTVNQGVLLANNATGSATGTGAVTVSGGVLGGTGIVQGNTLVNGAGSLRPGDSAVNGGIGRLRFSGNVELSGSTVATDRLLLQIGSSGGADVNDADGFYTALAANNFASYLSGKAADYEALNSGNHDQIIVAGTLTIEGNSVVRLGREDGSSAYSSSPAFGDVFDLLDFTTLLLDGYTFGTAQRAGGLVGGLDLPTLSAGLFYDTSLFASNGIIVVVPEPSRALLVLLAVGAWMMRRRKSF